MKAKALFFLSDPKQDRKARQQKRKRLTRRYLSPVLVRVPQSLTVSGIY